MNWSRRAVVLAGGAGMAALTGGAALNLGRSTFAGGELLRSRVPLPDPYAIPLSFPPIARPAASGRYEIVQREAELEILPGRRTRAWTYDGTFPGPTFDVARGTPIKVRHRNELPVPAAVHLHGGHVAATDDGWPLDLILPRDWDHHAGHSGHGTMTMIGDSTMVERTYVYPLDQRAATLWYHDHRMDFTGPAVYRGLFGMFLVRDPEEEGLSLPRGERELPLAICDRAFDEDGEFLYPALDPTARSTPGVEDRWMEGVLGDVLLVNGSPSPFHEVAAVRHRLRVLNGCNARRLSLVAETDEGRRLPFIQIGTDGGLLAAPVDHRQITLAPAERADLVLDLAAIAPGGRVRLRNLLGTGHTAEVLELRVVHRATDASHVPARLAEVEPLSSREPVREFRFTRRRRSDAPGHWWTINDAGFDPEKPLAIVQRGQVETWRLRTDVHHPVHVHLDPFQIRSRNGRAPAAYERGWKDTVDVRPYESVDIAVRFTRFTGRYLLHCHNLEHEDMAMMAAFDVI